MPKVTWHVNVRAVRFCDQSIQCKDYSSRVLFCSMHNYNFNSHSCVAYHRSSTSWAIPPPTTRILVLWEAVLVHIYCRDLRPTIYGIGTQKTNQIFPFVVVKPTQGCGFLFCSKTFPRQQKTRVFRHSANRRPCCGCSPHRARLAAAL